MRGESGKEEEKGGHKERERVEKKRVRESGEGNRK